MLCTCYVNVLFVVVVWQTYTMMGGVDLGMSLRGNGDFEESSGVIPRAVGELFRLLGERNAQCRFEVRAIAYYEASHTFTDFIDCSG